jgi:hypothetical protein
MNKQDEYLKNATDTVELAKNAPTDSDRSRLLMMAQAWLDLIDRRRKTIVKWRSDETAQQDQAQAE